jgi:hypothetical protein
VILLVLVGEMEEMVRMSLKEVAVVLAVTQAPVDLAE